MVDRDTALTELFARHADSLPVDDFVSRLTARIEREERKARVRTISVVASMVSAAVVLIFLFAKFSAEWTRFVVAGSSALEVLAASPIAWLGLLALLVALAPTVIVWQRSRMGRLGATIREQIALSLGK